MNLAELQSKLHSRASEDPVFRGRLLGDPAPAIEETAGVRVPDGIKITVFEQTPTHLALVLPVAQNAELSDDDLSGASGGFHENGTMLGK